MRYLLHDTTPNRLVILATLICVGIYWQGLYGPLLLDDISVLSTILDSNFGPADILPNLFSSSGLFKRPVSMFSFILNGLLGHDIFYWKLTNLVIHLATGLLLYLLTKKLVCFVDAEDKLTAAIVTSAWLLHPLQVSTVLYTVQRMTELSTLFVFAALLTYTIARERQRKGINSWLMQAITWLVLFPLGLLSKENALLFPAFVALIEIFLFSRERINNQDLLKIGFIVAALFSIAFAIKGNWILGGYFTRDFTLTERLLTESRVLIDYLGMLLLPAQNRMGFAHDDVIISHGLLDPWTTLPSILIIIALITTSLFIRKKHPLIGLGILFFFIGHAIESTIIPLELMYEHRNYLPSSGILLTAVATIKTIKINRNITNSFSIALFCLLIIITYTRTQTWASTESLYYYMEITHPRSERLATIKATQYTTIGDYPRARKRLEGFSSLGAELQRLKIDCVENHKLSDKQLDFSNKNYTLADNYAVMQIIDLANMGLENECTFSPEQFLALLNETTHQRSFGNNGQMIAMYQAHYLWKLSNQGDALELLRKTFNADKSNPIPLFLACEWMLDTNRLSESEKTCSDALEVTDKDPLNKYNEFAEKIRDRLKHRK